LEEFGPCPVFASYTLAFALQLRKKHGKTSVRENPPRQKKGKPQSKSKYNDTPTSACLWAHCPNIRKDAIMDQWGLRNV